MLYTPSPSIPQNDPVKDSNQKITIDQIIETNKDRPDSIMVILNELQSQIGYISRPMQDYIAAKLNVSPSQIHGIVTFYTFFTTTPRGEHTIKFCLGTACYVVGAPQLIDKAKQVTGIEPGQTTEDMKITMEVCRCVGACNQAPIVVINDEMFGLAKPNKLANLIKKLTK